MNPHAWIHVDVQELCERSATPGADDDADEETWACRAPAADEAAEWGFELGSPNGLMRQGWNRNSLPQGLVVTINGFLSKDQANVANARSVHLPDGRQVLAGSSFDVDAGTPAQ